MPTAPQLQALLAGTQCTKCGYANCAAYAEALATGATTNPALCAPGGPRIAQDLANALNLPLSACHPDTLSSSPEIAHIEEPSCIGCTRCLSCCPTSAIVGATKHVHTVMPEMCTGCGLCVPLCPTHCITLHPAPAEHTLTARQPDGSLAAAAQAATKALVRATQARREGASPPPPQPTSPSYALSSCHPGSLSSLSPELAALAEAARNKSRNKYSAMGPLRTPAALKRKP